MKQNIGITMGDPKGIGPEVIARSWKEMNESERDCFRIYGDRIALDAAAELVGSEFDLKHVITTSSTSESVRDLSDTEAARMAVSALDAAVEDVTSGRISAIVTAPVNKHRLQRIIPGFLGHTEYLASLARVDGAVMMFFSEGAPAQCPGLNLTNKLCVSLVTMHLPIKDVAARITTARVLTVIKRTNEALEMHFACPDARIAVMALNPHAGEAGSIGREEERVIAPAVLEAQGLGINAVGPLPADSLFKNMKNFDFDAIVAMYHDQGLIPVKLICQGRCINMTLGLPYLRTSPSHGTAEDLAWLGQASHENMLQAIRQTRELVGWKVNGKGGHKR